MTFFSLLYRHGLSGHKEPTGKTSHTRYDWREPKCNLGEGTDDKNEKSHPGLVEGKVDQQHLTEDLKII